MVERNVFYEKKRALKSEAMLISADQDEIGETWMSVMYRKLG